MNDPYDCHGGPGTTEPACGACITCLNRVIERLTVAGDALADCIRYDSPRYEIEIINRWDEAKDCK